MLRYAKIAAVIAAGVALGAIGRAFLLSDALADTTVTRRSATLLWTEYRIMALSDGGVGGVVCGSVQITGPLGTETDVNCTKRRDVTGARQSAALQLGDSLATRGLPKALKLEADDGGTL